MGREDEADHCYERALALDPKRFDALNNRALLMARRDDLTGAHAALTQLLEQAPGFAGARQNLVLVCLRLRRLDDALAHCVTGLVTAPQDRGLRELLGRSYVHCKLPGKAIEVYREWIEDDPEDPVPRHHLAALEGRPPERASDAYITRTFDSFAGSFDQILGRLDYCGPELVGTALRARLGEPLQARWRVLDAGCGTGLCAQHLAPLAQRLVGVDLSRRMLERAAQRDGYAELHQEELVAFMLARPASFDIIAAADTLCYFGALEAFASAALGALQGSPPGGGWLVFTVEALDDTPGAPDYRLHDHGRYSHRQGYVQAVLTQAGFGQVSFEGAFLRQELSQRVQAWVVSAQL